ncbi:hypothetical protein SEEH8310_13827 [Salmonella enterica subsp. enterica serovar Heidelberg str. 579083-10]|nr:hypothetical protein SEEH8310_13827 [Salmonella enterica subsp. enterica serovar Heidelberg str. 579083-10]
MVERFVERAVKNGYGRVPRLRLP